MNPRPTGERLFAAAMSMHPIPAIAAGEVIGQVLEAVGDAPDLALLFVTVPYAGALDDIAAAVRATLRPGTLLGCASSAVAANEHEIERQPAIVLWAGRTGPTRPFLCGPADHRCPSTLSSGPASALLLLADPHTFSVTEFVAEVALGHPDLPVVGGLAAAGNRPGTNRLVVNEHVVSSGAVGVALDPRCRVEALVSQGCRPIGSPLVVTRAQGTVILELASRPALERFGEMAAALPEEDRLALQRGTLIGRVIDERQLDFGTGDFLVRPVLGGDRARGAIVVGEAIPVGTTVQFQVRDADSADCDLRTLLSRHASFDDVDGVVLFTCLARGEQFFGTAHHDAAMITDFTQAPLAGMFCDGEVGPVGGSNYLHAYTASAALLRVGTHDR